MPPTIKFHLGLDCQRARHRLGPVRVKRAEVVVGSGTGCAQVHNGFAPGPDQHIDIEFFKGEVMRERISVGNQQVSEGDIDDSMWIA